MAKVGIEHTEDLHKELKKSRVQRDNTDLNNLVEGIEVSRNPFSEDNSDNLYNIATGKVASESVKNDLLNFRKNGESLCDAFRNGCFQDPARFEKSIHHQKINNFASAAVKTQMKTKDKEVLELKGTRDLFGCLVFLANEMKLDLQRVFVYPLTILFLCAWQV